MPLVLRDGGLRYFFSNEGAPREPAHVHVEGGGRAAKIWLEPEISVAESYGFNSGELRTIIAVVIDHRDRFIRAWHAHFADRR